LAATVLPAVYKAMRRDHRKVPIPSNSPAIWRQIWRQNARRSGVPNAGFKHLKRLMFSPATT
jgi:hypothetical protein